MNGNITIRTPKTLGCTLIASSLIQSLYSKFKDKNLEVYTPFPDLLRGLNNSIDLFDLKNKELKEYDIDLWNYVREKDVQGNLPYRHLVSHLFEIAEDFLGEKLNKNFSVRINPTSSEMEKAKSIVDELSGDKKLVWLQTKSDGELKNWKEEGWDKLQKVGNDKYNFIDLSDEKYNRRLSIAITKYCYAGITLDTFLLHGSHAVGSKNVILLLFSTHEKVVAYPENIVIGDNSGGRIVLEEVLEKLDSL
jgi:ADP-heptose:LPS heptosyltransferase